MMKSSSRRRSPKLLISHNILNVVLEKSEVSQQMHFAGPVMIIAVQSF
jgi:hypothetical protein